MVDGFTPTSRRVLKYVVFQGTEVSSRSVGAAHPFDQRKRSCQLGERDGRYSSRMPLGVGSTSRTLVREYITSIRLPLLHPVTRMLYDTWTCPVFLVNAALFTRFALEARSSIGEAMSLERLGNKRPARSSLPA